MGQMLERPIVDKDEQSGKNKLLDYGCTSMQGFRISMEDRHCCKTDVDLYADWTNEKKGNKMTNTSFFAIFDGHSGQTAAHFCSQHLLQHILDGEKKRQIDGEGKKARFFSSDDYLERSFLAMDKEFEDTFKDNLDNSGTTCISCLMVPYPKEQKIEFICCNVGDSRSVCYDQGKVIALSHDHKPTNKPEQARIEKAGGYVEFGRVNGTLALSRAFGDVVYKKNKNLGPTEQCVIAVPEMKRYTYDMKTTNTKDPYQFVVLACDGIWDVMDNKTVCQFVRERMVEQEKGVYYKKRKSRIESMYQRQKMMQNLVHPVETDFSRTGYDLNAICGELLDYSVLELDSKDNVSAAIVLLRDQK